MADAYIKIGWENEPSKKTSMSAGNLGHMDDGIEENRILINQLEEQNTDLSDTVDKNKRETDLVLSGKVDDLYVDPDTGLVYLMSNGERIKGPYGPFAGAGSGSGSGNNAALNVANTTGWISKTFSENEDVILSFNWSSVENDFSTGNGSLVVKVNGITKLSKSIVQGDVSVNVKEYLSSGSNTVRVTISDVYGNAKILAFNIERVSFSLTSPFDDTVAYSNNITFPYVPVGNATKTMQFILDGTLIGSAEVTTSNRQQTFTIPVQSHGAHSFEVYFTATINEDTVESNHLHYDVIFIESGNNNTVIASSFKVESVAQYYSVSIPWIAYTPNSATTDVELYVNDEFYMDLTVDRTKQIWTYRADAVGTLKLEIRSATAEPKVFNLTVVETDINVEAEENDLGLYLSSYGRSNNEANPGVWNYADIEAEFQNFNFVSDGWQLDNESNTVLRLSGDARLKIPYQIFAQDFRTTGKTIEFELATRDVLNYDAVLLSCMSGGRGVEITTQMAGFKSEQSSISTKYKEEEHVRISFVVEKRNSTRLLICYINGKISRLSLYPDDDDFSQVLPVDITIGSNDCITDIYNIRVYDNDLTRYQMLDNWIADTQNGYEKKARYDRNNIYNDYGQVTIDTLKKDTPYMVIICPVLPSYKGDKKTCSGYFVDPVHPERNFSWEEATIDVQGTSSQYYYIKNFKIKYKGGFVMDDNTVLEVYSLKGTGVGTNEFTMKADVASSEGWLNVILAQLYNELCPVKTPAQEDSPAVRQTIDGQPMVIFWNNGTDTQFYGKFNFNNDKGTPEVFGFESGDESWEILQNGTDRVGFKDADFSGDDWKNDFEARYPEDNTDTTKLQAFISWVASTNTEAATNETLTEPVIYDDVAYVIDSKEYRLAKFVAELENWASVDALVFYYLFTFIFLCIDQREKNAFPTWIERMEKWIMLFYDADSSMGTDNKGNLAFDYWLEDIDFTEGGDPVFNGQNSVLWKNIRDGFWSKISAEYKRLRTTLGTDGRPLLSYEVVMDKILAHVDTWCEAIYNEDAYKKYVEPYVVKGDTSYLGMAFGDKVEWAKYWLYNRFRYLDTLFEVGTSLEKRIMFRARAKGNVSLMSYINMYGRVYYNAETVSHRMYRDQEYEFEWGATGAEDAVIGVNDADMITSLGDLSPLMVEYVYASEAKHLTYLKVGDGTDGYVNNYLNELGFGNNVLMRLIDARNCPNLVGSIDMSGCTGLEEAYFTGSSITGLKLPNGCGIRILHLPDTVTNLTLGNLKKLEEFQMNNYSSISTLWIENTPAVDSKAILESIASGSRVRLIGFNWEFADETELSAFLEIVESMRGLDVNGGNVDTAQLIGTITIDTIESKTLYLLNQKYPDVKVVYNILKKYTVRFFTETTLLYTVENVEYGSDVEYEGETPEKTGVDDPSYFEFTGWYPEPTNIQGDTDCYAQYHDAREITDDWATVAANVANGTATSKYVIGACKPVEITYEDGTSETIEMEVVAHNHDELADEAHKWEKVYDASTVAWAVVWNDLIYYTEGSNLYSWDGSTRTQIDTTIPYTNAAAVVYNGEIHLFKIQGTQHYKYDGTEWTEVSTLPATLYNDGGLVVYNNEIHMFDLNHYKWDGAEWTTVAKPANNAKAVVLNDVLYAFGADTLYSWDGTNWTQISTLPYSSGYKVPFVYDNEIHIMGGAYNSEEWFNHYKYDGETWIQLDSSPIGIYGSPIVVYYNEINIFGSVANYSVGHYKWSGANWEDVFGVSIFNGGNGCSLVYNDEIHVLGDDGSPTAHRTINVAEKTATTISTLPYALTNGRAVIYEDQIHIFGGNGNNTGHYKFDGSTWIEVSTLPIANPIAIVYNNELYLFMTTTYYKWSGTEWTEIGTIPYTLNANYSAIVYDGAVHFMGGYRSSSHYKWDGTTWTTVGTLPYVTTRPMVAVLNNELHIMGGNDFSNSTNVYNKHYKYNGETWTDLTTNVAITTHQHNGAVVYHGHLYALASYKMFVYKNPTADLTFMAKTLSKNTKPFTIINYNDCTLNDWINSTLRAWCHNEILSGLPSDLQENIKTVKKLENNVNEDNSLNNIIETSTDKIWIPSYEELGITDTSLSWIFGLGEPYSVFTDPASRIRTYDGAGGKYWVRNLLSYNAQGIVSYNGIVNANTYLIKPNATRFVIGFCI